MRRLEGVDAYINETVANTAELEQRLEALQNRRDAYASICIRSPLLMVFLRALQDASKSRALKRELEGVKKKLSLQQGVLQQVADIQLKKNRRQKEAIQ